MRSDRESRYLGYIVDAIQRIEERTSGGRDAFLADDIVQDAVIWRLETLAEATGHLSDVLKERHPSIPWRDISDFRNRVAHGYLGINLALVWRIIEQDLSPLKAIIEWELREHGDDVRETP